MSSQLVRTPKYERLLWIRFTLVSSRVPQLQGSNRCSSAVANGTLGEQEYPFQCTMDAESNNITGEDDQKLLLLVYLLGNSCHWNRNPSSSIRHSTFIYAAIYQLVCYLISASNLTIITYLKLTYQLYAQSHSKHTY